jgi:hypothetical protein
VVGAAGRGWLSRRQHEKSFDRGVVVSKAMVGGSEFDGRAAGDEGGGWRGGKLRRQEADRAARGGRRAARGWRRE